MDVNVVMVITAQFQKQRGNCFYFLFFFFSLLPAGVCQQQSLTNLRRLERRPFALELLDVKCVRKCFYNYLKTERTDFMSNYSCLRIQIFSTLNRHNENMHSLNDLFCFCMSTSMCRIESSKPECTKQMKLHQLMSSRVSCLRAASSSPPRTLFFSRWRRCKANVGSYFGRFALTGLSVSAALHTLLAGKVSKWASEGATAFI